MASLLKKRVEALEGVFLPQREWAEGDEFQIEPEPGVMCAALLDLALVSFVPNDPGKLRELFGRCFHWPEDAEPPPITEAAEAVSKLMTMSVTQQEEFFHTHYPDLNYSGMGSGPPATAGNGESDDEAARKTAGAIQYLTAKASAAKGSGRKAGGGNGRSGGGGKSSSSPTKPSPAQRKSERSRQKSASKLKKKADRRDKSKPKLDKPKEKSK